MVLSFIMYDMYEFLKKYKIVLASNSPRRKELLSGLGFGFEVRAPENVNENYPIELLTTPEDIPLYIAKQKAIASCKNMAEDELIITADTIVIVDKKVIGKPKNLSDAKRMLRLLSGKTHKVVTGVYLTTRQKQRHFTTITDVTFKELAEEEINYYVEKFQPLDKAGAYGIQEWIGFIGVTSLNGSYFNVMGFPIQRINSELLELNK